MKKVIVMIALLITAAAVLGWRRDNPEDGVSGRQITLYGNVDIRQVRLGFRVGGKIKEVLLDEGDAVRPDTVIARLDDVPYRNALNIAVAQRDSAAAAYKREVNGPRYGEIARAGANAEELRANLKMAEVTFERYESLLRTNAIARETYDQAESARDAAAERLQAGLEELDLLLEGNREEDVAVAHAALRAAEATVASGETSLADTVLVAPSSGIVLSRVNEPGTIVSGGETVVVLSLFEPLLVRAYVPETLLGFVYPGKKVEVFTDTRPDAPHAGTIGFVSPVAEFTPKSVETPELRTDLVYRLRIIVDQPDSGLRQGMPVTVVLSREGK